jgi:hypothetical protein
MFFENLRKSIYLWLEKENSWIWSYTSIIPAPGRLRQENGEFEASMGYVARSLSQTNKRLK